MKIAVGADHRGSEVLDRIISLLSELGHDVAQIGTPPSDPGSCDYPDQAYPVASAVSNGEADRGILVCGSGIGMSITANKLPGVRAALVHDEVGADMSRRHNDANVICLPADMLGQRIISRIVTTWLQTEFEGGRHARRIEKITAIEQGRDPSSVGDPPSTNNIAAIG